MKRPGSEKSAGHTLIEVLVSIGILAILGSALVALLRQGIAVWHTAEGRGRIYERARAILDLVAEDLRSTATNVQADGPEFWIRFVCDVDAAGRPRLRLVRSLAGESSDPIAREGGTHLARADSAVYDHRNDRFEAEEGLLLAPSGYQEVIWAMDPDPAQRVIWRGVRSPIGGPGSLFVLENIEAEPAPAAAAAKGKEAPPHPLTRAAAPLAGGVLFFGLRLWTPTTNTWDAEHLPLAAPRGAEPSGPAIYWDSTRAILEQESASGKFTWKAAEGSLGDPYDDIFPEKVEVTLVLEGNPAARRIELAAAIGPGDLAVPLSAAGDLPADGPFRYVRIGPEWIRYERIDGDKLSVPKGGRGARGTSPSKHAAGTEVESGVSFRRIVEIPAYRFPIVPESRGRAAAGASGRRGR